MRRDLQEHHQLPSVNNLILAFGKFLSIPVLNRLCTSIPFCLLVTAMLQCWNIHRTEYKISQIHLDWEVGFYVWLLYVVMPTVLLLIRRLLEIQNSNKKIWQNQVVYCFDNSKSVVREAFLHLSYSRKHQLLSAALGADSNMSGFILWW